MSYVDGFVLVVPKKNTKAYQKMANAGGKMWKKYGAIGYFECMGDDLNPNMGGMKVLTFPKMAKVKKDETVWFSFIIYKSKKHRNEVNAKVMKDPSMNEANWKDKPMPFDVKKMAYGGFKVMVKK
ncbi:MAG TPA: DUF1428 domain-containing protein [Candidatus Nanoarchaeia archaeon]|nr:DUF1428 domain-containing protein [Candidatus Nanoarchaeia archaeon]